MKDYVLITGGHHSSAIPLIKGLIKKDLAVKFIGHRYASVLNNFESSEYKEISALGIDYINLKSPKFYKVRGFSKYLKLLNSVSFCLVFLIKNRPRIVVSYGGYLAVPVVIAAKLLFIKSVTHEQTLTEGLANKVIGNLVDKVLVSWQENMKKNNSKYGFVGLPLRDEIINVPKKNLGPKYPLKVLFVQGGKQGSHTLNEFVFKNIDYLTTHFIVYHQTSKHSINNDHIIAKKLAKENQKYFPFEFIFGKDYTDILTKSDFILSRSGAHIVYEMAYLNMPSIFVPIPWASENEQYKNAQNANNYVPSVILEESSLKLETFMDKLSTLASIVKTSTEYKRVEPNSAEKMLDVILKL